MIENKKQIYIILGIIAICFIYQLFFRYEYKIYEDKYSRGYVVKLDRLTGKVTQKYAEKESIFADIDKEVAKEQRIKKLFKTQ